MMIRKLKNFFLVLAITGIAVFGFTPPAFADFNHNLIMDGGIFSNTGTMSAASINNFLNQFPSSCLSPNNGFTSPDPTGYSPSTGYTYGGNVTGGQVIYDAALAYGINPQVLIATLQKESSVVTGTASYHCQYINTAMGYGCPDSGACPTNPATMSGFSKQIIHAAWLLRFGEQRSLGNTSWNVQANNFPQGGDHWDNSDDPPTTYSGPMTQGYRARVNGGSVAYYDGYTTIDGSSVHMDSGATAALYWYTPHFSGNQNFVNIFTGWFGPTTYGISLAKNAGSPVALAFNQNGSLQLVGVADNDSLYSRRQASPNSNSWTSWAQLGGALRNITAETNADGRIQLVGVANNGNIYTSAQTAANSTDWSAWTQLEGGLNNAALARNYNGSLEIFGVASNGSIYYKHQSSPDSSDWSAWAQLPGGLKSITADTNADGRIQLVGVAGNGNIYYSSQTAVNTDTWSAWTKMDGALINATMARNSSDGTLEVFGTAGNGSIYYRRQSSPNSNSWASWASLPGALRAIASEYNTDGRIQLVGVAGNGNIYYSSQTAVNTDTWSAWTQMDGALRKY